MKKLHAAAAILLAGTAAFGADPYLESDGTQYIDTGYVGNSDMRLEIDCQQTRTDVTEYLFGYHGIISGRLYACVYATAGGKYAYCCQTNNSDWVGTTFDTSLDRRTITLDLYNDVFSVKDASGTEIYTKKITGKHEEGVGYGTVPFYCSRNDGTVMGHAKLRVYRFRIYEKDELIHDFRPCVKEGEYGFKDEMTGEFRYTRYKSGSTPLVPGGDMPEAEDDAYLESAGNGVYINSGYKATGCTRIEFDYQLKEATTSGDQYLFGCNEQNVGLVFGAYVQKSGYIGANCQQNTGNWQGLGSGFLSTTKRRTLVIDGYNKKLLGIEQGRTNVNTSIDGTYAATDKTGRSIPFFASCNGAGSYVYSTAMRLYGVKIYESDVLVHDFVPCLKGDIPCLKDLKTGEYRESAVTNKADQLKIGGDFLKEPEDAYVHFNGITYLDLGIRAGEHTAIDVDYRLDEPANGKSRYVFGPSYAAEGYLSYCIYLNVQNYYGYCCRKTSGQWGGCGSGQATFARERFVLDAHNGKVSFYRSGVLLTTTAISADYAGVETYHPLTLGANRSTTSTSTSALSKMRVYGCKVYESGELTHNFVPYVKDSTVGLRDTMTGAFCSASTMNLASPVEAGGAIEANVEEGAYLLSTGTQAINTGYLPGPMTKIEVDFALTSHTGYGERIFGSAGGDLYCALFGSSTSAGWGFFAFAVGNGDVARQDISTGVTMRNVDRHVATLDYAAAPNGAVSFTTTNVTWTSTLWPKGTVQATWPLGLFAEPADADFRSAQNFATMKLYSAKIYESGMLVRHYLPYKNGTMVGLKEVLHGDVLTDVAGSSVPFKIGGCGWGEGREAFYCQPTNSMVSAVGESMTLQSYAPGAVAYQWLRDGKPIPGETGELYTFQWRKVDAAAKFSVRATFERYGEKVTRVSNEVSVGKNKAGFLVIVK